METERRPLSHANHGLQQKYGWGWPVRPAHPILLHPQKDCSLAQDRVAALPGQYNNRCLHLALWDEQCQAGAAHGTQRLHGRVGVTALWWAGELITFLCPLSHPQVLSKKPPKAVWSVSAASRWTTGGVTPPPPASVNLQCGGCAENKHGQVSTFYGVM